LILSINGTRIFNPGSNILSNFPILSTIQASCWGTNLMIYHVDIRILYVPFLSFNLLCFSVKTVFQHQIPMTHRQQQESHSYHSHLSCIHSLHRKQCFFAKGVLSKRVISLPFLTGSTCSFTLSACLTIKGCFDIKPRDLESKLIVYYYAIKRRNKKREAFFFFFF
jgi:hypothetical protein